MKRSWWKCQGRWNGAQSVRGERRQGAGPAEGRGGCAGSRTKCDPSHARNQRDGKRKPQRNFPRKEKSVIENKTPKTNNTSSIKCQSAHIHLKKKNAGKMFV